MSAGRIGKIARLANLTINVDRSGNSALIAFPGLSYDDINRAGKISINRILHWFTSIRIASYHIPNPQTGKTFLEYDKMTENYFTFMASAKATVEREFYSLLKTGSAFPKLDIELHLGYVGTSSLNSVASLVNSATGQKLASNVNQVVVIDRTTRTPTLIPEWWRKTYEGAVVENERLIVRKLEVPTSNTHRYPITVVWSDTDAYKHTNYLSYVRFCLDAAMDAMDKGMYTGFHNDIYDYDLKTIENLYAGESKAGENLVVTTWQDEKNPFTMFFSISRQDKAEPNGVKVVFQSTMEFYPPSKDS